MKNSTKKLTGFLLLAFALMAAPLTLLASSETNNLMIIVKDDLVGGWEYTATGAPEGYDSGLLMIVKAGDTYKVQVQLAGGAMNGTDVVVKGNDIKLLAVPENDTEIIEDSKEMNFTSITNRKILKELPEEEKIKLIERYSFEENNEEK